MEDNSVQMAKGNLVYFYVPNIIGYIRFVLLILFLVFAFTSPIYSLFCYVSSHLLDSIDGYIGKKLNQTSTFGALLDMTLDRVTIAVLLLMLAVMTPQFWWFFCGILAIDVGSHFSIIYASGLSKSATHKTINWGKHKILNAYYSKNRTFMFILIVVHDVCLCTIYGYYFYKYEFAYYLILFSLPGVLLKAYIHLVQWGIAMKIAKDAS